MNDKIWNNDILINYYKIFTNSSNAVRSFFTIISDLIRMNIGSDIIDADIIKNAKYDNSYITSALRKIHSNVKYKTSKKCIDISESSDEGYHIKYLWGYDVSSSNCGDLIATNISLKVISGTVDRYKINISFEFCSNEVNDNNIKNTSSIFNNILLKEIVKAFSANKPFSENSAKYNTYLTNKKFNLVGFNIGNRNIVSTDEKLFRVII